VTDKVLASKHSFSHEFDSGISSTQFEDSTGQCEINCFKLMLVAWRRIPRQLGFPDAGESEGAKSQRDKEDRSFSSKSLPPVHPVVRLVVIPISSLVSEGKENQ